MSTAAILWTIIFISSTIAQTIFVDKIFKNSYKQFKTKNGVVCPAPTKYGSGPPATCTPPTDPNNRPVSKLESWLTRAIFYDLFPKANLGWGPNACFPYSYEAFIIAARYFPNFGTTSPAGNGYTSVQNTRRDVSTFFAHAIQETGENNAYLYTILNDTAAGDCFYRGGLYEWFEGGPTSAFLDPAHPGWSPADGNNCKAAGLYCESNALINYFYPCGGNTTPNANGLYTGGCYFGRGAIQISYNYNYGQFQSWLKANSINVNLLAQPNLIMTHMNPPLAIMASLWFYMTPQPPKPAMHDIILGNWNAGATNIAAGYTGPIFGPTSLVINDECGGEDSTDPGGPGENRRIKAFIWFCGYFGVPTGAQNTLSCKNMPVKLDMMVYNVSYEPNWSTTWMSAPCQCSPASYQGMVPYFDPSYYPAQFVAMNSANQLICARSLYGNPEMYGLGNAACLNFTLPPG